MGLVKATRAFYHDSVGSRAHNEVFEVKNEQVCAQLEQTGYVQKVEGQEAQMHQQNQQLQQEMGKKSALTNEAVSLAHHAQNQEAAQHQQNVEKMRQQQAQAKSQSNQSSEHMYKAMNEQAQKANAKKAEK